MVSIAVFALIGSIYASVIGFVSNLLNTQYEQTRESEGGGWKAGWLIPVVPLSTVELVNLLWKAGHAFK